MFVAISDTVEAKVTADIAWKAFSGLGFSQIAVQQLPQTFLNVDVLEGDGGVRTVLQVTICGEADGVSQYTEKFVAIDDRARIKVTEGLEGGTLDLGIDKYWVQFHIMEKGMPGGGEEDSCIIEVKVEYETEEMSAAKTVLSTIESVLDTTKAVADYLATEHKFSFNGY